MRLAEIASAGSEWKFADDDEARACAAAASATNGDSSAKRYWCMCEVLVLRILQSKILSF
jgi:hypothetical protein